MIDSGQSLINSFIQVNSVIDKLYSIKEELLNLESINELNAFANNLLLEQSINTV
jgi:hypothetical protein